MLTVEEYVKLDEKNPKYNNYEGSEKDLAAMIEYNKALVAEYPFLFPINTWTDLIPEDYDYSYTEMDCMPYGWRIAFGDDLLKELKDELIRWNYLDKYRIVQIKEKFGGLRWYDAGYPADILSECIGTVKYKFPERHPDNDNKYYKYIGEENDEDIYEVYNIIDKCHVSDIIYKYELLSEKVCIECGKPVKWETKGWITFICDECAKKIYEKRNKNNNVKFEDYFIELKGDN